MKPIALAMPATNLASAHNNGQGAAIAQVTSTVTTRQICTRRPKDGVGSRGQRRHAQGCNAPSIAPAR